MKKVDAREFYANEEIRLTALVEEERQLALSKPLGIAFVTLGLCILVMELSEYHNIPNYYYYHIFRYRNTWCS